MSEKRDKRINKIVVCSDGTGQSGGMLHPSNVWRLYLALKKDTQSCYHDDGVGTGGNRFFRAIGGAFGFGISRNIKQIYQYLISEYDHSPDVENQLFFFGFSRGAFTVRVLAQMVCLFGVPNRSGKTPAEIEAMADKIVSSYATANLQFARSLENPNASEQGKSELAESIVRTFGCELFGDSRQVHFLGVWDTVEAVGLPIDELTQALNFLFPLKFRNNIPNPRIKNIYHALAIDEERRTFTPKVFDEPSCQPSHNGPECLASKTDRTIRQVWFPGCHAHVGGGYGKDQLALNCLNWMIHYAEENGVEFNQEKVTEFRTQSSEDGQILDSRTGLRMFYRYGPRSIQALCNPHIKNNTEYKTKELRPVVLHESTWNRIRRQVDGYSPSALYFSAESAQNANRPPILIEQHDGQNLHLVQSKDLAAPTNQLSGLQQGLIDSRKLTRSRSLVFYGMFFTLLFALGLGAFQGARLRSEFKKASDTPPESAPTTAQQVVGDLGGKVFNTDAKVPNPSATTVSRDEAPIASADNSRLENAVSDSILSKLPDLIVDLEERSLVLIGSVIPDALTLPIEGLKSVDGVPFLLLMIFTVLFFADKQSILMIRDSAAKGWESFRKDPMELETDSAVHVDWRSRILHPLVLTIGLVYSLIAFYWLLSCFEVFTVLSNDNIRKSTKFVTWIAVTVLLAFGAYRFVLFPVLKIVLRATANTLDAMVNFPAIAMLANRWKTIIGPIVAIVAFGFVLTWVSTQAYTYVQNVAKTQSQVAGDLMGVEK